MTDQELLEHIAKKDSTSFKVLYDRYSNQLNGWAYSRLNNREAAADIMQEFWAFVWSTPQKIRPDEQGCAKQFLTQNVSFRILKFFHKQYNKLEITNNELLAEQFLTYSYTHVQEETDAKEILQMIEEILQNLPELSRQIYRLRYQEELSVKETAKSLGIAESTVRNGLSSVVFSLRHEISLRYKISSPGKLKNWLPLLFTILWE